MSQFIIAAAALAVLPIQDQSPWLVQYSPERGDCAAARFGTNEEIELLINAGGGQVLMLTPVPVTGSEYREFQIDGRSFGAIFQSSPRPGKSVVALDTEQVRAVRGGARISYEWTGGSFSTSLNGSNAALGQLLDCASRADDLMRRQEQQLAAGSIDQTEPKLLAPRASPAREETARLQALVAAQAAAQEQERRRLEGVRQGDMAMRLGLALLQGGSSSPNPRPRVQTFSTPTGTVTCVTHGDQTSCN